MASNQDRNDVEATFAQIERAGIDPKAHRRILQFINDATSPEGLLVAPHDRLAIDEEAGHADDLELPHDQLRIFDLELAEQLIRARQSEHPVLGFAHLRELFRIDPRIIDRIRDSIASFGPANYGRWDMLYDIAVGGVPFEIEHAALTRTYEVVFLAHGTDTLVWDPSNETTPQFQFLTSGDTGLTANVLCGGHSFLSDGRLLVVGGGGFGPGNPTSNQGWKFDPAAKKWEKTAGNMSSLRWYPTVLTLGDESGPTGKSGRVLVAGDRAREGRS